MLKQALEIEILQFLNKHSSRVYENGHNVILKNGYHPERDIVTCFIYYSNKEILSLTLFITSFFSTLSSKI